MKSIFAYLEGEPVGKGPDYIVLAVGGVGFRVFVPQSRINELSSRPVLRLYTHLVLREDSAAIFGLSSDEELSVFRQLISVSGVGPRLALGVLSTWSSSQLQDILVREDINALTSVAGIGRKTAQRLLLELKDKIELCPGGDEPVSFFSDAEAALVALGFRASEVRPTLRTLVKESSSVEDLVRRALASLAGGEN